MSDLYRKIIITSCIRVLYADAEVGRKLLSMPIFEDKELNSPIKIEDGQIRFSREHLKAATNDELFEALRDAMTERAIGPAC